ncbi:Tms1p [Kluyveromyces lactis]|uniref:KLLA0F11935p n=1 Tax=Kluyveromyces lactis (strain ATCC 8585 / CBS 2359 / DSM 70799 / NBRC 1267 / NRRL Y-1140 / WM37) TaxID=284590 RepID=Q6CKB8_KLULA|nr:uncharacterized protein KLLA0_F11935g [Kluyveromyces lactis]CAG98329.1 KLLA0F11935p [Kluyveromyces lactis]|eukprot:XP_455621.1 uncharacterized protein KLLA0_F11935g [Kluyveromyces lactis]
MGLIISLPVQMAATCFSSMLGSCCSSSLSSLGTLTSSSLMTRITYALWLLVNSVISWVSMSTNKSILWPDKSCTSTGECGFFTVHRLNFALGMMHIILAFIMINIKSTADARAKLQNGAWSFKFIFYLLLILFAYWIPNEFYIWFSKWVSVPSGFVFILIGLVLLVDFAHEWAETCIQNVELEDERSSLWRKLLIGSTSLMYIGSAVMMVVMFTLFCHDGCDMNRSSATINVALSVIVSLASIHPRVQEFNPKCGLAQSSMVSVYCTYLTMSAMASEPDDKFCNPLVRTSNTRKFSTVLGALFTFIAIAYTTTRAAANNALRGSSGAISLYDDDVEYSGIGETRNQLRLQAIKQAVEEGALPQSALLDYEAEQQRMHVNDSGREDGDDDEFNVTKYNYSLFHFIFFLATQWIVILLTINVTQDDVGDFIPVGRTYFYSWVKIISAWICYGLYGWTLFAPIVMPERFEYDY